MTPLRSIAVASLSWTSLEASAVIALPSKARLALAYTSLSDKAGT